MPLYRKVLKPINNTFITEEITNEYTVISINESDINSNIPILENELLETDDLIVLRGGNAYKLALEFFPFEVGTPSEPQIPFTPSDINTSLWLDAHDSSTIQLNGNNVTQWNDKSGNGRNVSQGTAVNRPVFANNGITFDGIDDHLFNTTPFMYSSGSISIFVVTDCLPQDDKRFVAEASTNFLQPVYLFGTGQTATNNTDKINAFIRNDSNPTAVFLGTQALSVSVLDGTKNIVSWIDTGISITGISNGFIGTTINYSRSGTLTLNRFSIGAVVRSSLSSPLTGTIFEVIIISGQISIELRQKIEGYLAHKWNLFSKLPSFHPYKDNPPYQ